MSFRASFCGFPYLKYEPDNNESSSNNSVVIHFNKEFCCIADYISYLKSELSEFDLYSFKYGSSLANLKRKELHLLISKFEKLLNDFIKEN